MIKKTMTGLLFTVLISLPGYSDQYGEAHNKYLSCFNEVLPGGRASILDVLDALVVNCGYPVQDYAAFISDYSFLAENTLLNLQDGGIERVIAPYARKLKQTHKDFLISIEKILVNTDSFKEAYQNLEDLYKQASDKLCGSQADIATLAAIDIAAHSALYWGPQAESKAVTMKAKWWQVVLADAAGGVVGGLFGGGVGAVGLGSACSGYVARLE